MRPKTWLGIAATYFPKASRERLDYILWEHTGFPGFWNIPEDGNTPEQCLRTQLRAFRKYGRACYRCGKRRVPLPDGMLCAPCIIAFVADCEAAGVLASTASAPKEPPDPPSDPEAQRG